MDFERKNWDSHIYLYAKNWYKRTDLIEDLRIIVADRCGIDAERIMVHDIISVLLPLTWKAINDSSNPLYFFEEFVVDQLPMYNYKGMVQEGDTQEMILIKKMLGILANVKVKNPETGEVFIELDEPDPNLLPLATKKDLF